MTIEKLNEILGDLKRGIEEFSSRSSSVVSSSTGTLSSTADDVRAIPEYLLTLQNSINEIQSNNKDLEEKIMNIKQAIETVTTETEISESNKGDLIETEGKKRSYKEDLERQIAESQQKKAQLDLEFNDAGALATRKEQEYNQVQISTKEEIERLNQQIIEATTRVQQAESENKLIVYLMDAGLMDVPEAEVVAIVAAYPNGLKIDEIKKKVNMPPVRVQPTVNNLLETVLQYDALSDSYKIIETIKKELL
ncbi:MAG: hypothetical protein ACTSQF_06635 [Candidatus Heimdallarchaeaceae archaeon]